MFVFRTRWILKSLLVAMFITGASCYVYFAEASQSTQERKAARQLAFDTLDCKEFLKNVDEKDPESVLQEGKLKLILLAGSDALPVLDRALKLKPNNIQAMVLRSQALLEAERTKESLANIDRVIAMEPRSAAAFAVRARCSYRLQRKAECDKDLKQALELDSRDFTVIEMLSTNLKDDLHEDEALEQLNKLVQYHPKNIQAYMLRSDLLEKMSRTSDALADYATQIKLGPRCYSGYLCRAKLKQRMTKYAEAIPDYLKVLDLDTFGIATGQARNGLCDCYELTEQYAKAAAMHTLEIPDIEKQKGLAVWQREHLLRRATDYTKLKQYKKALQDADLGVRLSNGNRMTVHFRAKLFQTMGEHGKAIGDYSALIATNKGISEFYRGRAASYKALGKTREADSDLKVAGDIEHHQIQ